MSLATVTPVKTFPLGIIASKALDDPSFIEELVGDNLAAISHIYTNGANPLPIAFAQEHGIPYTVFPLINRSLPWSNSQILEHVQFVYVIADPASKSAAQAIKACEDKGVKHKLVTFESCAHWRSKVQKIGGIIAAMTDEDLEKNPLIKSISSSL